LEKTIPLRIKRTCNKGLKSHVFILLKEQWCGDRVSTEVSVMEECVEMWE